MQRVHGVGRRHQSPDQGTGIWARVLVALAENRNADALAICLDVLRNEGLSAEPHQVDGLLLLGAQAALRLGSGDGLADLLEAVAASPIDPPVWHTAHLTLQRARLAALRGEAEPPFAQAVSALREVEEPFWVATALLEQAEWHAAQPGSPEIAPHLTEARQIFARLRVPALLERVERLEAATVAPVP